MTADTISEVGVDQTVLVGDGSHSRAGRSKWLVAEVDESDGSLVLHHPKRAIVTNIELDHTDHFPDVEAVQALFAEFVGKLPADGLAVLCADDVRARSLTTPARKVTYGFDESADYRCDESRPFTIHHGGRALRPVNLRQRRRPNIPNATSAAGLAPEIRGPFEEGAD